MIRRLVFSVIVSIGIVAAGTAIGGDQEDAAISAVHMTSMPGVPDGDFVK